MIKIRLHIALIFVIVGQFSQTFSGLVQAAYSFAYIAIASNGEGRIISINPANKTTSIKQVQIFPNEYGSTSYFPYFPPYPSWVSPSGEWIAVDDIWSNTQDTVRLINTRSGAIRDLGGLGIILVIAPAQ